MLILGLTEAGDVVFDVQLRKWERTERWVGFEMGPVVEIDWLEVKLPFRSAAMTRRVLCEALTAATDLAGRSTPTIGMVTQNERLEAKLDRRRDFHRVSSIPMPFVAARKTIEKLGKRVCRGVTRRRLE